MVPGLSDPRYDNHNGCVVNGKPPGTFVAPTIENAIYARPKRGLHRHLT